MTRRRRGGCTRPGRCGPGPNATAPGAWTSASRPTTAGSSPAPWRTGPTRSSAPAEGPVSASPGSRTPPTRSWRSCKEGPRTPIEVRLDASEAALARGYTEPGERCEITGVGPVPVTIARSLLSDARITVFARRGNHVVEVSPPTRTIPAKLRRRLERLYPVCGNQGCQNDQRLEIDHVEPFATGGPTDEHNCWRLCPHCHHLKTHYHWNVTGEPGARRLVPPDDPDPP